MAKKPKKPVKPTPGKRAYLITIEGIAGAYETYAAGNAEDDDFPTPPQAVLSLEVLNTASTPETCSISVTAVATGITTVLRPDTTMQPNELWTFRNVLSGNTTGYSAKVAVACAGIVREYSYWVTQTMTCRYAYWEGSTFWVSCQPG